jgi:hypothetical protein
MNGKTDWFSFPIRGKIEKESSMKRNNNLADYKSRYKKLYDFIDSYNTGQVDKHLIGSVGGYRFDYIKFEIGTSEEPVVYFKTHQPDLLERLMDKCGEWFVSGRHKGGVIAFLNEQDVTSIRVPVSVKKAGVLMH